MIAMILGVKLAPGGRWAHGYKTRMCVYPYLELMRTSLELGVMHLWQAAAHVAWSTGDLDLYDVLVDTVLAIRKRVGHRTVRPDWMMPLVAHCERERVERKARAVGRSLAQRQLPPRGTDFRATDVDDDRKALLEPVTTEATFWTLAGVAMRGLVSSTLTREEVRKAGLTWNDDLCDRIDSICSTPSYDSLIEIMQPILIDIAMLRASEIAEPENVDPEEGEADNANPKKGENENTDPKDAEPEKSKAENTEPGKGEEEGSKSEHTDEPGSGSSKSDPADSDPADGKSENENSTPPNAEQPESQNPGNGNPTDEGEPHAGAGDPSGTENAGGTSPSPETESQSPAKTKPLTFDPKTLARILEELATGTTGKSEVDYTPESVILVVPSGSSEKLEKEIEALLVQLRPNDILWDTVSRSNMHITQPISHAISEFLTENEIGEIERGTRSGRIDFRAIARPPGALTPPFMRRAIPSEHSYDITLVVDRSGSMISATGEMEDPTVFGATYGTRWHLALRMVVGLVESLAHLPNTRTAVVLYDQHVNIGKGFEEPLTDDIKNGIVDMCVARGDNNDAGALAIAIDQFKGSEATKKMIIYLTDGEFCSDEAAVKHVLARSMAENIEMVFLTVGMPPNNIRRFVPDYLSDEITPVTISTVLRKHITRMLDFAPA
jgi:hypothetical protein